jgi:hypothetical protein
MLGVERSGAFRTDISEVSPAFTDDLHLHRPKVQGKFLFAGDIKLWIRGVTYGTFRPDADGNEYHDLDIVERDFAQMAENGLNTIRTYTVPARWLLDAAQRHGLRVMVGLPWEQHVTFLDDKQRARSIEDRIRAGVRACLATQPSCAMRLAMRSRPLSSVGMGNAAWSNSLSVCTELLRMRTPKGWSRT